MSCCESRTRVNQRPHANTPTPGRLRENRGCNIARNPSIDLMGHNEYSDTFTLNGQKYTYEERQSRHEREEDTITEGCSIGDDDLDYEHNCRVPNLMAGRQVRRTWLSGS